MKTIVTQIEQVEEEIASCESRLDAIERLCRLQDMSEEKWKTLQQEKKSLEQQIVHCRTKLKGLRWENWRTMIVSVILLGAVYLTFHFIYSPSQADNTVQ